MTPLGMAEWRGATSMRNSRGDMGEPCGVPTSTGALVPGAPWKTSVQERSERKEVTQ